MVVLGNSLKMQHPNEPPAADAIRVDEQDHYNESWVPPFELRDVVSIRTSQKFKDYYELYEEIGEGKFGKVFRCVEKETGLELAAKCIRLKKDADLAKVEKEVSIMTHMRHKCITQIYDAFANSATEIVLIMEIVSGGELFDRVVDDNYVLTETAVAMIMYQICEAIRYIHSQKIIHLDLKPENIMCVSLTGNQIKLIDFGLAQYYDGQADLLFMAGTPEFAAPEVIKYEPLDFHTDMWSLGVIAYILLSGQSPFLGDNIALTYCNVEKGKWSFCEEFEENGISDQARDFISKLLIVDKSKRMLPDECLQHAWIQDSLERARNKSLKEKPLDTGKLRSYVRNKRFRRLVFGVLFINSVTRMMTTLQSKKSENGIQYVQNMLNATIDNSTSSAQALVKSAFKKRQRNATGENAPPEVVNTPHSVAAEVPSTSQEGDELHRKPKRLNNGHAAFSEADATQPTATDVLAAAKRVEAMASKIASQESNNVLDVPIKSDASSPESSRTASPKLIKRQRDKAKAKSSSSRKASSSEQAAKKPKQGSSGTLKAMAEAAADLEKSTKLVQEAEAKKTETSTSKVGGILARLQQQADQNTSTFTLPVACAVVPPKKQNDGDVESSVKVTLTRPEDRKPSLKIEETTVVEEKPVKTKKLKKVGSSPKKSKSNSATIDLNAAKDGLKSAANETVTKSITPVKTPIKAVERKSADSALDSNVGGKRKSVVSALLQKLEQNDAPPLMMAVSSVVHTPKVENAVVTEKLKSKVLRIEPLNNEEKKAANQLTTSTLNLEKKVVSEKKTKLTKKDQHKQLESGDSTSTKGEREDKSVRELSVRQKTTVNEVGAETKVESQTMKLANSVTSKERGETKTTGNATKHLAEKSLESVASIDLQKAIKDGKKLRTKKQLAVSDEESSKAGIDAMLNAKRMLKRANGTAEKTHVQKAVAIEDGVKGSVQVETKKSVAFSNSKPKQEPKVETQIRFSIEDDVAAFKALMNKRHKRQESKLASDQETNMGTHEKFGERSKLKTSQSLSIDENDDDDSLIQSQADAFDFSILKSKLESRLSNKQASDQDSTYLENCQMKEQNLLEIRAKLTDTGNIKRAMNKWLQMDKETSQK